MHIRTAANEDLPLIIHLYQQVARQEGGLARNEHEITEEYVRTFFNKKH